MKIGIDIDEVLAEFTKGFLEYINRKRNIELKKEQVLNYDLNKILGSTREEAIREVENFYEAKSFEELEIVEHSNEALNYLSKFHELHLITARPERLRDKTNVWIKKKFFNNFKGIYFGSGVFNKKLSKAEICEDLGIDVMIEDNMDYATSIAKKDIKVFLIDCPWNQSDELHENITRVKDWREIVKHLSS